MKSLASTTTCELISLGQLAILEAFASVEALTGKPMKFELLDRNREGDHICYISDLSKMKSHFPEWDIGVSLGEIYEQIVKVGGTAAFIEVIGKCAESPVS